MFCACTTCYPSVPSSVGSLFDILPPETRNSALGNTKRKPHSMLASLIETHALLKNTNSNAEPSIQDTGFLFPKEAKKAIDEAAADAAAEAETRANLEREEKVAALTKLDLPVKRDWEDGAEKAEKIDIQGAEMSYTSLLTIVCLANLLQFCLRPRLYTYEKK